MYQATEYACMLVWLCYTCTLTIVHDCGFMSAADLARMDCAHKALKVVATRLGYPELKKEQREAVLSFVQGKDVFVSLPMGYGKSLCYGMIPLVVDEMKAHKEPSSIVLVVSPLISLMKDQVKHLQLKVFLLGMLVNWKTRTCKIA